MLDNEDIDTDITDDPSKAVMLFGRDLRKIPCFRNTMLYGINSGLGAGIITFMLTSRINLSTKVALGSYMGVALFYWCYCRYNFVQQKYSISEMQQHINQQELRKKKDDKYLMEEKSKLIDV